MGENEWYYYIIQENVYMIFIMLNRENCYLYMLELNSYMYCLYIFFFVRMYKWLCINLEIVSSWEFKFLISMLLSYVKIVDVVKKEILF